MVLSQCDLLMNSFHLTSVKVECLIPFVTKLVLEKSDKLKSLFFKWVVNEI